MSRFWAQKKVVQQDFGFCIFKKVWSSSIWTLSTLDRNLGNRNLFFVSVSCSTKETKIFAFSTALAEEDCQTETSLVSDVCMQMQLRQFTAQADVWGCACFGVCVWLS